MTDNAYLSKPRDLLMRQYTPELQPILNDFDKRIMDENAKLLLGTDEPGTCLRSRFGKSPEEDPDAYIKDKKREYIDVNYRYARIFDLCRVIGVRHIFDIGCQGVNQAFLLGDLSIMSYTGMDLSFSLNDWRERDAEDGNYTLPITGEAPPPFANGRIRFVKGRYPETAPDVPPESIVVGCYSMTMTHPDNIPAMAQALHRDFDRMLFNVPWSRAEAMDAWKTAAQAWTGFTIRPIGNAGFIYATRHREDLERLSAVYPVDEKGRIVTGIDDGMLYLYGSPLYAADTHADWFRDPEP